MSSQKRVRERVTHQIIEALESGNTPPWWLGPNAGFPANVVSRKAYRGIVSPVSSAQGWPYPPWKWRRSTCDLNQTRPPSRCRGHSHFRCPKHKGNGLNRVTSWSSVVIPSLPYG